MPSSHWNQIDTVIEIFFKLNPKSVIDIGCGFGKWGFLLREYLEVWQDRYHKEDWTKTIDAVEPNSSYITTCHHFYYDTIFEETAQTFFTNPENDKSYDLALFIDCIEHVSVSDGVLILTKALQQCKAILIVTPKKWYPQNTLDDYQTHRSHWKRKNFRQFGKCQFFNNKRATIVLINAKINKHEFKKKIRNKLGLMKQSLKRLFK
ncbi:MAG: class I SAM-dependent methyltransferase [Candidatus Heimdallarchaeota archaeon]|nr:class I SAM-dependent methyltransferase [Candidatus Heimdallarchaeota archaeon]